MSVLVVFWGIAQLGERLNGIQEVSGSIPLISTKIRPPSHGFVVVFYPKVMRIWIPVQKAQGVL